MRPLLAVLVACLFSCATVGGSVHYLLDASSVRYDLPETLAPAVKRALIPLPATRGDGQADQFTTADGGPEPGLYELAGEVQATSNAALETLLAEIRTKLGTAVTLGFEEGSYSWERAVDAGGALRGAVSAAPVQHYSNVARLVVRVALGEGGASVSGTTSAASTISLPDGTTPTGGTGAATPRTPWLVMTPTEPTYTGTPALIEYSWGQKADALTTWDYDLGLALADLLDNGTSALLPVVAGDLALLYVYARDNAALVPPIITTPSGWSLVAHAQNVGGTMTGAVYSRILTAGDMADASYNVSLTADRSVRWRAVMDFWRTSGGVVTAGTPVMDGTASTTSGTLEVAGLNNIGPGTACIAAFGYYTTTTYPDWSDPSGWNSFTGAAGGTAPASRVAVSKRALASGIPFPSASLTTLSGKDASEFIAVPFLIRGN